MAVCCVNAVKDGAVALNNKIRRSVQSPIGLLGTTILLCSRESGLEEGEKRDFHKRRRTLNSVFFGGYGVFATLQFQW